MSKPELFENSWKLIEYGVLKEEDILNRNKVFSRNDLSHALGVTDPSDIPHFIRINSKIVIDSLCLINKKLNRYDAEKICTQITQIYIGHITELDNNLFDLNYKNIIPLAKQLLFEKTEAFFEFLESIFEPDGTLIECDAILEQVHQAYFKEVLSQIQLGNHFYSEDELCAATKSAIMATTVQFKFQNDSVMEGIKKLLFQPDIKRLRLLLSSKIKHVPQPKRRVACRVHHLIEFPKWMFQSIIDTPSFQRLRRIKQLGACWTVYPNATHTRFEHSLGVGHLAQTFWGTLVNSSECSIYDREIEQIRNCLAVSGLCHDLGHGPYSHTFESYFMTKRRLDWKHEDMSIRLFDHICDTCETFDEVDRRMIHQMILGHTSSHSDMSSFDEIESLKRASYTIVANKSSGVDVDRFDYLQRDASIGDNLPVFKAGRIMEFARVINGEICFAEKEARNVLDMFTARYRMFQEVYSHRKVRAIEFMICDILEHLDDVLSISQRVDTVEDFLSLDDSFFDTGVRFLKLENFKKTDPDIADQILIAKSLLHRIEQRDTYRFGGELIIKGSLDDINQLKQHFSIEKLLACQSPTTHCLTDSDIILDWTTCHHGTGSQNPMETISFFDPSDPLTKYKVDAEVKRYWLTGGPRVYCRRNVMAQQLKDTFLKWQKEYVPKHFRGFCVKGVGPRQTVQSPGRQGYSNKMTIFTPTEHSMQ